MAGCFVDTQPQAAGGIQAFSSHLKAKFLFILWSRAQPSWGLRIQSNPNAEQLSVSPVGGCGFKSLKPYQSSSAGCTAGLQAAGMGQWVEGLSLPSLLGLLAGLLCWLGV